MRAMALPRQSDIKKAKRLGRYLLGRPRYVMKFTFQSQVHAVNIFTDLDWAGDKVTRKSTSGGILQLGNHCLKSWSSTQTVIALSSGEAEFYSITKGAAQGMGLQSLLQDMGISVEIRLMTDASTGKVIASRRGLGKVRHIATHELWIQDEVLKGRLTIIKLKNILNTSDVLTKYTDKRALDKAIAQLDHHFEEGRSPVATLLGERCEPGSTHQQTSAIPDVNEFRQTMARPIVHTSAIPNV